MKNISKKWRIDPENIVLGDVDFELTKLDTRLTSNVFFFSEKAYLKLIEYGKGSILYYHTVWLHRKSTIG